MFFPYYYTPKNGAAARFVPLRSLFIDVLQERSLKLSQRLLLLGLLTQQLQSLDWEDAEAMELYRQYAAMEQQARTTYEAMHGPITQFATAGSKNWNALLQDPWPWNYQEGGMK